MQEQIDAANALTEDEYTTDSWDVLQAAVEAAESLSSSEYSSESEAQAAQNDIDQAAQRIAEAIAALQRKPFTEELSVAVGQSISVTVDGTMTQGPDETFATAVIDGNTMTITGVAAGTTTVVVGAGTYHITVTDIPDGEFSNIGELTFVSETGSADYSLNQTISHLILTPGVSYDLALYADGEELGNGYTVSWESADSSIASVNNSGRITANRVGETTVTATVTDRDGNIVGRHIATVTVIDDGNGYSREVEFYVADVQNTTLYYVENGHTGDFDFIAVEEGTVIYGNPSGKWNMVYFAAPDEGYALTYLSAANNYGTTDWTSIRDNQLVDPANSNFQNAYGDNYYNQVLQLAQGTYGCDGCFWFTRDNTSGGTGECRAYIIAISEKLPTVEKSVAEVNGEDYAEDMAIHVGDTITFAVTVTRYQSTYGSATAMLH